MRVLIYCLFFALAVPTPGQSSEELRKLYGQPKATSQTPDSENFALRDKFDLIAQYGQDRRACKLIVVPVQPPTSQARPAPFIPAVYVPILLQEIAPATITGARKSDVELPAVRVLDFEEVRILEPVAELPPIEQGVSRIVIFFKRAICPPAEDPVEFFEKKVLPLMPSSRDLRTRFGVNKGKNDLSQDVVLVSDIKLEISYLSDGRVSFIRLTPIDPLKKTMPSLQLVELLETLVPSEIRGKRIGGGGFQSTCGGASGEEYEYAQISRTHWFCEQAHKGTDTQVTIHVPRALYN